MAAGEAVLAIGRRGGFRRQLSVACLYPGVMFLCAVPADWNRGGVLLSRTAATKAALIASLNLSIIHWSLRKNMT